LLAAAAFSFVLVDAKLKIVRVENSPSLAIQYSGAKAARAEIRVNGVSSGIRDIKGAKTSGMVAFKIDLGLLNKGDNLIEAFIYDANGKVLGSERTTIVATSGGDAAVKVQLPKNGQTVQGTVQIQVGLGVEMKEAYVSFFVDKQFRSLKNFPPFTYYWDTTQETNGWHEVEAWTFDQSQATRKSAPVKVLINNPGGRTERQNPQEPAPKPAPKPQPKPAVQPAPKPVLKPAPQPVVQPAPKPVVKPVVQPAPKPVAKPAPKPVVKPVAKPVHKPILPAVTPKPSNLNAVVVPAPKPQPKPTPAPAKPALMKIAPGTRVPTNGAISISMDGKEIPFDVTPRVSGGVPLSPFRHLFESAGGEVDWKKFEKICTAKGLGKEVWIKIGDMYAKVDGKAYKLEVVPFIEQGRTIVPLSFISEALNFNVDFDPVTRHVLITKK
jgi:hypothetical protein